MNMDMVQIKAHRFHIGTDMSGQLFQMIFNRIDVVFVRDFRRDNCYTD